MFFFIVCIYNFVIILFLSFSEDMRGEETGSDYSDVGLAAVNEIRDQDLGFPTLDEAHNHRTRKTRGPLRTRRHRHPGKNHRRKHVRRNRLQGKIDILVI